MVKLEKFIETSSFLIPPTMSTLFDTKLFRLTNSKESPYLIKKNRHVPENSVVTQEQSKFIKPVQTAIFSMILEEDPDLTTSLKKLLKNNRTEQQSSTFCFRTPKNPNKTEDYTTKKTRILKEILE